MLSEPALAQCYLRHCRTVWNICYPYFMNAPDTEDAVQETFLRLAVSDRQFHDENHEKAWLIRTARSVCKDELKRARRRELPLEAAETAAVCLEEPDETLQALSELPEVYRTVLYLHYYEGLSTGEVAQLLGRRPATVRSDLRRGRALLKSKLGGNAP